jgi:hypothetical protein
MLHLSHLKRPPLAQVDPPGRDCLLDLVCVSFAAAEDTRTPCHDPTMRRISPVLTHHGPESSETYKTVLAADVPTAFEELSHNRIIIAAVAVPGTHI